MTDFELLLTRVFKDSGAPESLSSEVFKKGSAQLNKLRPYVFNPELVRGCNIRCEFCVTRLFPPGERKFMSEDVWYKLIYLISQVNPTGHITFATIGEPTLHPKFLEFIELARAALPEIQIELYTNGITLIKKDISYKDIFSAGVNSIFVDMYHPVELHKELANESGISYHIANSKEKNPVNIFLKRKSSDFKYILLAPNPLDWSNSRYRPKKMQTWLNNLDWDAAKSIGMEPVASAPRRRCDQLQRSLNVLHNGEFNSCCLDCMNETNGVIGSLNGGLESFIKFWFGPYMQASRKLLFNKDRNKHPLCSRCSFISGRADIPLWPEDWMEYYFNGEKWEKLSGDEANIKLNEKSF